MSELKTRPVISIPSEAFASVGEEMAAMTLRPKVRWTCFAVDDARWSLVIGPASRRLKRCGLARSLAGNRFPRRP
jgi:hypothetical protein